MNDYRKTNQDELHLSALLQFLRKESKLIVLTIMICLAAGVLYGLFYPKEYESHSIISIGKIYNIAISTPKDLEASLDLITIPDYTDLQSNDKVEYESRFSNTNLKIIAISKSPKRAYELNQSILDTILNRHNKLTFQALEPIELAITNISTQIDYYTDLIKQNNQIHENLASLALFNNSITDLINNKEQIVMTRVIIQPQIPEVHARPKLVTSILLALLLGISISFILLLMKREYDLQ